MKLNKLWASALALFALVSCNQDLELRQEQLQTPQVETKLMDARLEIGTESAMRVAYGINPDPNAKGATNGLLLNSDKDLSIRLAVRETTSNKYAYQTLTFKKSASGNSALFVGKISVPAFPEGTDLTTLKFQISGILLSEVDPETGAVTAAEKVYARVSSTEESEVEFVNPTHTLVAPEASRVEVNVPYVAPWRNVTVDNGVWSGAKLEFFPQGTLLRMRVVNQVNSARTLASTTFRTDAFVREGKFSFTQEHDNKPKFITTESTTGLRAYTYQFPQAVQLDKATDVANPPQSSWFYTWVMPTDKPRVTTTADLNISARTVLAGAFSTKHKLPLGSVPMTLVIKPQVASPFNGIFEVEGEWGTTPEPILPLEFMVKHNLKTETEFATTNINDRTQYLLLNKDDAVQKYADGKEIGGKQYYLPRYAELEAIFLGASTLRQHPHFEGNKFFNYATFVNQSPDVLSNETIEYGGVVRDYQSIYRHVHRTNQESLGYGIKLMGYGDRYRVAYRYHIKPNPERVTGKNPIYDKCLEVSSRYIGADSSIGMDQVADPDFWTEKPGVKIVKRIIPFISYNKGGDGLTIFYWAGDPAGDPATGKWNKTLLTGGETRIVHLSYEEFDRFLPIRLFSRTAIAD